MIAELTVGDYAFLIAMIGGQLIALVVAFKKVDRIEEKTNATDAKADVIKAHVDGRTTQSDAKITELQNEIASLKGQRAEAKQVAALLAQAEAGKATIAPQSEPVLVELAPDGPPMDVVVQNEPKNPVPTKPAK